MVYIVVVIEKLAYGFTKLSFLFFYRRIFAISPLFRKTNNILIGLIILWTFLFFMLEAFVCGIHPEAHWSGNLARHQQCLSQEKILLAFAITDVVSDGVILSMPYPSIRRLQMSTGKKVGVGAVFMLGAL